MAKWFPCCTLQPPIAFLAHNINKMPIFFERRFSARGRIELCTAHKKINQIAWMRNLREAHTQTHEQNIHLKFRSAVTTTVINYYHPTNSVQLYTHCANFNINLAFTLCSKFFCSFRHCLWHSETNRICHRYLINIKTDISFFTLVSWLFMRVYFTICTYFLSISLSRCIFLST